jgi:hypothetical protein
VPTREKRGWPQSIGRWAPAPGWPLRRPALHAQTPTASDAHRSP